MTIDLVEAVLVAPSYKAIRESPYVVNYDSYDGKANDYFARVVNYNPGSREHALILDSLHWLRSSRVFLYSLRYADLIVLETSASRQWVSENRALRNADGHHRRTAVMVNLEHLQTVKIAMMPPKPRTIPPSCLLAAVSFGALAARLGLAKLF